MAREIEKTFAKNVLKEREARDWTQDDLAKKIGCTRQYVQKKEDPEQSSLSGKSLAQFANAFGIPAGDLLRENGEKSTASGGSCPTGSLDITLPEEFNNDPEMIAMFGQFVQNSIPSIVKMVMTAKEAARQEIISVVRERAEKG